MKIQNIFLTLVSPAAQIIATFMTSIIAFFMAYQATKNYDPFVSPYHLHAIEPGIILQWNAVPPQVKVGLYIYKFSEFNLYENRFVFEGILWFRFDPALVSLSTIEKFSFDYGEIIHKTPVDIRYLSIKLFPPYTLSELIFASYDIKVKFSNNLNYRAFPLDDHRLDIALQNYYVSPREMIFQSDTSEFILSPAVSISGWEIYDKKVHTGYEEAFLDNNDPRKFVEHPKVIFSIDLNRSGLKDILLIVLPLFLILFISLFAIGLDPKENKAIIFALVSGAVPAMVAYRFVIQNMSPHVSYFMMSDYIFGLFLLFAGINFIISMFLIYIGQLSDRLIIIRGLLFILCHVIFLAVWYYLLFHFIIEKLGSS